MRSRGSGNLTALLMFVVLLIVPLLAVFGIPEFVPASISFSDDGGVLEEMNFVSPAAPGAGESASYSPLERSDVFAHVPYGQNATRQEPYRPQSAGERGSIQNPFLQFEEKNRVFQEQKAISRHIPPDEALTGWEVAKRSSQHQQKTMHGHSTIDPVTVENYADKSIRNGSNQNETADAPLTWKSAVSRLNKLGIRKYRLEPGARESEFHFCCFLTPRNNPRVTHRFEAEAADPLLAVEKVLRQIEAWHQTR